MRRRTLKKRIARIRKVLRGGYVWARGWHYWATWLVQTGHMPDHGYTVPFVLNPLSRDEKLWRRTRPWDLPPPGWKP